jgi:ribulose-phosphate 3-epimerase
LQWVEPMADAGANMYSFHHEATDDPVSVIRKIKEAGMKVRIKITYYFIMLWT